jgi:hypothetical protein
LSIPLARLRSETVAASLLRGGIDRPLHFEVPIGFCDKVRRHFVYSTYYFVNVNHFDE